MIIRHKGIYKPRFDAPFVGTLISAISCPFNCEDCINDPIKPLTYETIDSREFLDSVANDPFSEGIILGGLEWTQQSMELFFLIRGALDRKLQVILYTWYPDYESLCNAVPCMRSFMNTGIYVKFGKYDNKNLADGDNVQYGVSLASRNQYIRKI